MLKIPFLATLCLLLSACSDTCENTIVSRMTSPDGQHDAVIFQRDCGATTGFSTQISIKDTGKAVSGGGNAFSADDDHGAAHAGHWGGPWAETQWNSPTQLIIRYATKSRVFEKSENVEGVTITYQAIGS